MNPYDMDLNYVEQSVAQQMKSEIQAQVSRISNLDVRICSILGDGNCLYRAISLGIAGNEDHHEALRQMIVEHMDSHKENIRRLYALKKIT